MAQILSAHQHSISKCIKESFGTLFGKSLLNIPLPNVKPHNQYFHNIRVDSNLLISNLKIFCLQRSYDLPQPLRHSPWKIVEIKKNKQSFLRSYNNYTQKRQEIYLHLKSFHNYCGVDHVECETLLTGWIDSLKGCGLTQY